MPTWELKTDRPTSCLQAFLLAKTFHHSYQSPLTADRYEMASGYGSLAREAIVLLDRFSAGRQCLDDFMEDASKDLQVNRL